MLTSLYIYIYAYVRMSVYVKEGNGIEWNVM